MIIIIIIPSLCIHVYIYTGWNKLREILSRHIEAHRVLMISYVDSNAADNCNR